MSWTEPRISWKSLEPVAARLELAATSKFDLRTFDVESTRCNENESRCNELAQIMICDIQFECRVDWSNRKHSWNLVWSMLLWVGLCLRALEVSVYHCNGLVRYCSEICCSAGVRLFLAVARGHCLVTFRCIMQLLRRCVRTIMYAWWKVIVWLLINLCTCWYTRTNTYMEHCHGEPEVIVLLHSHDGELLVFRWHDRRGQHGRLLGRMCLYALERLSGMTDEVSTVVCWIGCVEMHQSRYMNHWQILRLAMYELLNYGMNLEHCSKLYWIVNCVWSSIIMLR